MKKGLAVGSGWLTAGPLGTSTVTLSSPFPAVAVPPGDPFSRDTTEKKKKVVVKIQLPGLQYAFQNISQVPQKFLLIAKNFSPADGTIVQCLRPT